MLQERGPRGESPVSLSSLCIVFISALLFVASQLSLDLDTKDGQVSKVAHEG